MEPVEAALACSFFLDISELSGVLLDFYFILYNSIVIMENRFEP